MEWPGKDGRHPRCPPKGNMPKGNADVEEIVFYSLFSQSIEVDTYIGMYSLLVFHSKWCLLFLFILRWNKIT